MSLAETKLSVILLGVSQAFKVQARRDRVYSKRLAEKNLTAQIRVVDNSVGRYFTFKDGKVTSKSGIHASPDVEMIFASAKVGARLLTPPVNKQEQIDAAKNFQLMLAGPDDLTAWFTITISQLMTAGMKYGKDMGDGVTRYVSNTNGGPVFVYVKDDKIIRLTPIEFDSEDAQPWSIKARGKTFTPPRKTTLPSYSYALKSMVYSQDRLLHPMKRVDFDPNGERNLENRGISGYERISWDEALDIVASEIKRVRTEYGKGTILSGTGSHHLWGWLGYWLS
ncbi:MAG: molybdopterin-dependent oxidoreductase, partial [Candidatus Promineifilaceae bacterium]